MPTLTPVKSDPFASDKDVKLTPVSHNPFAPMESHPQHPPLLHDSPVEAGERDADSGFINAMWQGRTYGYGDEIDGAIARHLYGDTYGNALEDQERKNTDRYRNNHPYLSTTGELIGSFPAPILGKASSLISGIESGVGRLAGNIGLGAAAGAAQGSGEATQGHRLSGAAVGGLFGAGAGGLLHSAGNLIGSGVTHFNEATHDVVPNAMRSLADKARELVGFTPKGERVPTAVQNAAERLRQAIKDDKVTPDLVEKLQKERADHGLPPATVAQAGDENTSSVLRYASSKLGEGRSAAVKDRVRQRTSLAGTGVEHSEAVRPAGVKESPAQRAERLTKEQQTEAATTYREPYAKLVPVDDRMLDIVSSDEAKKALTLAEKTAGEWLDRAEGKAQAKQIGELKAYTGKLQKYEEDLAEWKKNGGIDTSNLPPDAKALLEAAQTPAAKERVMKALKLEPSAEPIKPEPPQISAGALDRIRIAMRNRADSLKNTPLEKKGTHALGVTLTDREKALDQYIEGIGGLKEARGAYQEKQAQIDAANFEHSVLDMDSRDFAQHVATLSEEARNSLRVKAHQEIIDAFRRPGQAQAMMERLATDKFAHQNLAVLMGPDEADRLSRAAWFRFEDLRKANKIAPDTGSQTSGREADKKMLAQIWHSMSTRTGVLNRILSAGLQSGQLTLNKEEATALERMGRGSPEELLELLRNNPRSPLAQMVKTALAKEAGGYEGGQSSEGDEATRKKIDALSDDNHVPDSALPTINDNGEGRKMYDENGKLVGTVGPDGRLTVEISGDQP